MWSCSDTNGLLQDYSGSKLWRCKTYLFHFYMGKHILFMQTELLLVMLWTGYRIMSIFYWGGTCMCMCMHAPVCARAHAHTHRKNYHKYNLTPWLTSGSAFLENDGILNSSIFMPMKSSSLETSTSFSALIMSMFCRKINDKNNYVWWWISYISNTHTGQKTMCITADANWNF
jgi:hypothetical protein